jgi:hypothetical protein
MPRVAAYALLGFVAGNCILLGIEQILAYYAVVFYPLPLVAIAGGIVLARGQKLRARRAFVWGCWGIILSLLILLPFGASAPPVLPITLVGLAAGALVGQRRVDAASGAATRDGNSVGR